MFPVTTVEVRRKLGHDRRTAHCGSAAYIGHRLANPGIDIMTYPDHVTVQTAKPADFSAAAAVLARAFTGDPVITHYWPRLSDQIRCLPRFFTDLLHQHHRHGHIDLAVAEGQIVGAALWLPPNTSSPDRLTAWARLWLTCGTRTPIVRRARRAMNHLHPTEPHWYLSILGTEPTWHGAGHGRALLAHRHKTIDYTRHSTYLVCTQAATGCFYARAGYRTLNNITIPSGPTVYWMHRPLSN